MIDSILCMENGKVKNVTSAQLQTRLSQKKPIWIDVLAPTKEDMDFLQKKLFLHKLAIKDCLSFTQRPKLVEFPEQLFMVVHDLHYNKGELIFNELDIFLGKNFVVTVHRHPVDAVKQIQQRISEEPGLWKKGSCFIVSQVIAIIVEAYFPVLDALDDTIDEIEDVVFKNPTPAVLNKTFKLKRSVLELRKTVSPQRDAISEIIMNDSPLIHPETLVYYRNIYDHLIRMHDLIDTYRDLITGILDAYLSVVSNRMNEVMKVLTMFATVMMPLTLIAGIYGMNFKFIPEIHTPFGESFGYFFALGLMLSVGLIMIFFFKRKQWL